jgi:NAD dependent epimerase/dehydratase family enzyme
MRILITGSSGMVARHLVTALQENTDLTLLTPSRTELNLLEKNAVDSSVSVKEYYSAAAKVIGYEGDFTHDLSKLSGMRRKLMDVAVAK